MPIKIIFAKQIQQHLITDYKQLSVLYALDDQKNSVSTGGYKFALNLPLPKETLRSKYDISFFLDPQVNLRLEVKL